jgi:hypothetical protein
MMLHSKGNGLNYSRVKNYKWLKLGNDSLGHMRCLWLGASGD